MKAGIVNGYGSAEELLATKWNTTFIKMMQNRLIIGAIRYGKGGSLSSTKSKHLDQAILRLKQYKKDRNPEHLVDVANMCMLHFTAEGMTVNERRNEYDNRS